MNGNADKMIYAAYVLTCTFSWTFIDDDREIQIRGNVYEEKFLPSCQPLNCCSVKL